MAAAAITPERKRTTVALCLRIREARMALTITVDSSEVAGLSGSALHNAVYPAAMKALEDLTFEVVELRED